MNHTVDTSANTNLMDINASDCSNGNKEYENLCAELLWIENEIISKTRRKKEIEAVLKTTLQNQTSKSILFQNEEMQRRLQIESCSFVLKQYSKSVPLRKKEEQALLAEFLLSTSPRSDSPDEAERAKNMAIAALSFLAGKRTKKITQFIEKKKKPKNETSLTKRKTSTLN